MAKAALTREEREWAYARWREGYTQQQIADALFVCDTTIRRALRGKPRIRPILVYKEAENDERCL